MGRVVRRSIDSARSTSAVRRISDEEKILRRNSSCINLFQLNESMNQSFTTECKNGKKRRRFSFKRWFNKTVKPVDETDRVSVTTGTPECHPMAVNSVKRLIRSMSKNKVPPPPSSSKTPILRQRELIISSGIIIWEEDIDFTLEEQFCSIARICSARTNVQEA